MKGIINTDDISIPQNARAHLEPPSDDILNYLSIDPDKKPLLTTLKPETEDPTGEDNWDDHDYIEIPTLQEVLFDFTKKL